MGLLPIAGKFVPAEWRGIEPAGVVEVANVVVVDQGEKLAVNALADGGAALVDGFASGGGWGFYGARSR